MMASPRRKTCRRSLTRQHCNGLLFPVSRHPVEADQISMQGFYPGSATSARWEPLTQ